MNFKHLFPNMVYVENFFVVLMQKANASLPKELQRTGFYFTVIDNKTGQVLLMLPFGTIPREKQFKYMSLSIEKGTRLFQHPKHLTSGESKDELNDKFPGAIRGIEAIYSASGQHSSVDAGLSLAGFLLFEPSFGARSNLDLRNALYIKYLTKVYKRNEIVQNILKNLPKDIDVPKINEGVKNAGH